MRAIMAAGPAGRNARPELYREHEAIPPRGPLAALTVPGAVGGWMLALEAAQANGARLPLDVLLAGAIAPARSGYGVTPSQARLTHDILRSFKSVPGFAATFLLDGKAPEAGATLKQEALAETLGILPMPASTTSIAAMSGARSLPTSITSAARLRARIFRVIAPHSRHRFKSSCRAARSTTPTRRPRALHR